MQNIVVTDEGGNSANLSTCDVYQSNGVINVIDTVLMPKLLSSVDVVKVRVDPVSLSQ